MVITEEQVWEILEQVPDPEVPVLSVVDLGIVRGISFAKSGIKVIVTPTYSGCPATDTIAADIKKALWEAGFSQVEIQTQLSPAWTTDWLSIDGKRKLEEYGIAPPVEVSHDINSLFGKEVIVPCPRCKSRNTRLVSQFGSTACKALYSCVDCEEPFDYFKCLK